MMLVLVAMFRSDEFLRCEPPVDHQGNTTARDELGYGCTKVGTTHGPPLRIGAMVHHYASR